MDRNKYTYYIHFSINNVMMYDMNGQFSIRSKTISRYSVHYSIEDRHLSMWNRHLSDGSRKMSGLNRAMLSRRGNFLSLGRMGEGRNNKRP